MGWKIVRRGEVVVVGQGGSSPHYYVTEEDAWRKLGMGVPNREDRANTGPYDVLPMEWHDKAAWKIIKGERNAPIWSGERWWGGVNPMHFPHISAEDPSMLAYYESPEKGEAGRITTTRPGKYLKKYFSDTLSDKQILFYAEWWQTGSRPSETSGAALKFAKTEAEIISVYAKGPGSCMSGKKCVGAYAAGDLAVAYLEDDRRIIARALCWPDKKVFGRVYPSPDNYANDGYSSRSAATSVQNQLLTMLKKDGWTHYSEVSHPFDGAKLRADRVKQNDNRFWRMPYIDGGYRLTIDPAMTHFKIDHAGLWQSGGTNGTIEINPAMLQQSTTCYACGSGEAPVQLFSYWCPTCEAPEDPHSYCRACAAANSFTCPGSHTTYTTYQNDRWSHNGVIYSRNWFLNNCFEYAGNRYLRSEESTIHPGRPASMDPLPTIPRPRPNFLSTLLGD